MTAERAAGVLCWRRAPSGSEASRPGGLEVLLVHRPRYDDWSWPKGGARQGEPPPCAAVRETAEEAGLAVVLGRPLGEVRYRLPSGRRKQVTYWAATPAGPVADPGPGAGDGHDDEVDAVAWLSPGEARSRLTRASDAAPLDALEQHARAGELDTVAVLVVRHGTSRPRDSWARADADRPLLSAGRRQARALVPLLACWRPERIVSSPWRRCLETVAPFAEQARLRVRTKDALSETGSGRHPARTRRHVRRLLERGQRAVLCTHRPVLAEALGVLRDACGPDVAADVPAKDPFLAPGEVLVAHLRAGNGAPAVVAVERHPPLA